MRMGMGYQEVGKRLRRDDHGGDGFTLAGEEGCPRSHEVAGGGVGDPAEFAEEGAVEEEGPPEGDRDREDELAVGDEGEDLLDHALGPFDRAALAAGTGPTPALPGRAEKLDESRGALLARGGTGKGPLTRRRMAATLSPGRGQELSWRVPRAVIHPLPLGEGRSFPGASRAQ